MSEKNLNPAGYPAAHDEDEFDIRELLMVLNRRRAAIAGIFLLVVVVTLLYLYQETPLYTAEAQLTLNVRQSRVVDIDEVLPGISPYDSWLIATEIDTIRSSTLLEKVADELNLERNPEFNPALRENGSKGLVSQLKAWLKGLWFLDGDGDAEAVEMPTNPEEDEDRLRRAIVGRLRGNLSISQRSNSYTINFAYTAQDPRTAAEVVNTLADLYLTDQLEAKFEATRKANEWLAARLKNLREEVKASEQAMKNVRQQSDMILSGSTSILDQQISNVNAQLIQARVKQSRAEARLQRSKEVLSLPGGIDSLGEVLGSDTIKRMREEESALRRKRVELSQRYGPRHPEMIQIEAEMRDLQAKREEEGTRLIESLENEVQVAKAEVASLMDSLDGLRTEAGETMEAEMQVREIERQAESSRALYENFLQRFQETRAQNDLQRPDARIISRANVPEAPSHPNKQLTLMMGLGAGMMFGVMGAFLLEKLDKGFRTGDQVEKTTGLPFLGTVPLLRRADGEPVAYVVKKPFSAMSESLRAVRTGVHLSNVDEPPKTVMVTSALPQEGKSTFSMCLGRLAALSGARVLVVETDLRRPSAAKWFSHLGIVNRLEDVILGQASLEEAVVKDPESGLDLLMAHGKASSVREMLGSQRMKDLLAALKEKYDLIVIDTPPIMGVSDAWSLARNVDSVVMIVRWAETPRDTVRAALRQMEQLEIPVSGIVLSMVNMRQQGKYGGYGGYGYYYGKYRRYYEE